MKKRLFVVVAPLLLAIGGCIAAEKSSNPLGPSVAGPIPGVNITAPRLLDPRDGNGIAVDKQPVTLVIENAATTGVRPLTYVFEIASDSAFVNKVFTREGVAPGDGGRTLFKLPDSLSPERTYYWRSRAEDGANTGPYSGLAFFKVFTPIVIHQPVPVAPINNATTSDLQPKFTFVNAPRSGPVGPISYELQVAENDSFSSLFATWSVAEQPNQTMLQAPVSLAPSQQYFWRVHAYDPTTTGPWSATQVFRTPAAAPGPTPGGSCASQGEPLAILQCRRNQYGATMSAGDTVNFLRASAKDFNSVPIADGPFGILRKTSGTNCLGYSCDILCAGQGDSQKQWDVLIDADPGSGPAIPVWGPPHTAPNIRIDTCEIQ